MSKNRIYFLLGDFPFAIMEKEVRKVMEKRLKTWVWERRKNNRARTC